MPLETKISQCSTKWNCRCCRWRSWELQLRAVLCWLVFFVMIAFYLPVVAAIQALLQVSTAPVKSQPQLVAAHDITLLPV